MAKEITLTEPDPRAPLLLSGNQAIARGAIEASVSLVTGYPGTPSTYVIETLLRLPDLRFRVEWSINEKVAFELATGVSWAGLRSMVTMKMSGLNVAADSFLSVQYSGVTGGLVLYVADDPNVYYGMVEQDSRHYARLAVAPMLMPATPQEALDFTRLAFELSEKIGRPVMVQGTTTLANTYELVRPGRIASIEREPSFEFNIAKYAKAGPAACVLQHQDTLEALEQFGRLADDLNPLSVNGSRTGVIATGVTWNYLQEALHRYELKPSTLKVGVAHPVPTRKIKDLLSTVDRVVILEELEPFIEEAVLALRGQAGHPVEVIGKLQGPLSRTGDYNVDVVASALREVYGDEIPQSDTPEDVVEQARDLKIKRLNTFCVGCPHRATYYALNQAIERLSYQHHEVIITGDIGCTILGMNEPFQSCWTEISMGSSISLAQGFKYAGIKTPVVATIGDGTFFHGGIPALLNASHNKTNLTVIILDNHWASMTGMQPHVGSEDPDYSEERRIIMVEEIVKAAGIQNIQRVNPYQTKKMQDILMEAISSQEISVIISDAECAIQKRRRRKGGGSLRVRSEKCIGLESCEHSCIEVLGCPALGRAEDGKAFIDPDICTACGLCHHVCSYGAI
jgi:indolepyruvate ferredoxin oxidoreductase alpha subunit